MQKTISILKNEEGTVIVVALLILVLLTIIGISGTNTTVTELQIVGNDARYKQNFYNAEAGLIRDIVNPRWLTTGDIDGDGDGDGFLDVDKTVAWFCGASPVLDSNGSPVATIEVRCIENTGATIAALSNAANDLPVRSHTGPPPDGSGYSLKYFEVRRYGVTATSATGNTQIQAGVWKVFNKS